MITFIVTYRHKGRQCTAHVVAFDEQGARARFASNYPGVAIIGVRRKATDPKRRSWL